MAGTAPSTSKGAIARGRRREKRFIGLPHSCWVGWADLLRRRVWLRRYLLDETAPVTACCTIYPLRQARFGNGHAKPCHIADRRDASLYEHRAISAWHMTS